MKKKKEIGIPTREQLEKELHRSIKQSRINTVLRIILYSTISLVAAVTLILSLWFPVLQVYGSSMAPNFQENEFVVCLKADDYEPGDVVAFYHNKRILVRRIIAGPDCWVFIDEAGNVNVDGLALEEPYLTEKSLGQCDRELPYQVPANGFFVMGDNRADSVDSRSNIVGSVSREQIVGKIVFRIWPFERFGSTE